MSKQKTPEVSDEEDAGRKAAGEEATGEEATGEEATGEEAAGDTADEAGRPGGESGETAGAEGADQGSGTRSGSGGKAGKRAGQTRTGETHTEEEAPAGEVQEKAAEVKDAEASEEEGERRSGEERPPEHSEGPFASHADELAYHEETVDELADQVAEARGHRTLWATLFFILLGALAVAGVTLWGAPKVAPYLPAGVARYLVPGQLETAERLAALEQRLATRAEETDSAFAGLSERLASLESEVEAAASNEEVEAAIAGVRETAEAARAESQALAERLDGIEGRVAGLRQEVGAISDTLSGAGEGAAPAELAAAVASLRARLDQLAGAIEGGPPTAELAERLAALRGRVDELEKSLVEAREAGSEASDAIRETRLQTAFDTLSARLAAGQPYAAALSEITALTGAEPPEVLAGAAENGLPTATELEASFGRHAQAAIAADIRARSGEGTLGQAMGWLRAQVAGRPVIEQAGDGVPAITSRIAARLEEGRLEAALAEAEALPEAARAGLDGWLDRLRARVEAEAALGRWRDQIAAKG